MEQYKDLLTKILCGTQDKNILYYDLQKILIALGFALLAGCMIDGKTKADAVRRIDIAINEWIEIAERLGRNIPEPKNRLSNYRY